MFFEQNLVWCSQCISCAASKGGQIPWVRSGLKDENTSFCLSGRLAKEDEEEEEDTFEEITEDASGFAEENLTYTPNNAAGESSKFDDFFKMLMSMKPSIRIAIGLTQVLNGMNFAFSVPFPQAFKALMAETKVLSVDIFALVTMGCLGKWDFYDNFYAQIILIPVVLLVLWSMYALEDKMLASGEIPLSCCWS